MRAGKARLWLLEGDALGTLVSQQLKAGVIGAGVFGGFHARKYAASPHASLVGVYDPDTARAEEVAGGVGAHAFDTAEALITASDVITIASPAATHYDLAGAALRAGRHVYVEKPLAMTIAQADALIALASARKLILQVGHQERFVLAAMGLPRRDAQPSKLEFARCGPANGRCEEVSAVLDLMIHDLDIARLFGFARPIRIDAAGDQHETVATLTFADGRICSFIASRRSNERRRFFRAEFADGAIEIDFLERRVINASGALLAANDCAAGLAALTDPLGASVEAFLHSASTGNASIVDGAAGRGALELALLVDAARDASIARVRKIA
jgi:predicted dehydrogenase